MTGANDTKSKANESASKARGVERAAARRGEASELPGEVSESIDASNLIDASDLMDADDDTPQPSTDGSIAPGASSVAAPPIAAHGVASSTQIDQHVEPLVLQPDFEADDREQYHVTELLVYHDRHFIENVYKAILRRAPSLAESARELDDLRGGRAGKVEIIERLLSSPEARAGAGRRVRVEGLPSPLMRRLGQMPVIGYVLRLVRALARLPLSMQHQRQFEIYALAQQQLIADYLNRTLAQVAREREAVGDASAPPSVAPPQQDEIGETLAMFSDALLELSNSHAELQAQTQTQAEQAQAALEELTAAITAQQQLADTFRREQQLAADTLRRELLLAADAQQEFLIQEQRVIVETQQVVLEELREELRQLSARQQRAREELDAEVRRLGSLQAAAARENFSGQA
ncbi:MAG TPA: hypothetical protein VGX24_02730 [Pyrinomonadaceae bacterium]|jgi:hypothetical protein|nr:hypothetical protein [Pyrinomonadaceae bacterium]